MMLIAATDELRRAFPQSMIAVAPDATHPFQQRAKLGLWHRAELKRMGLDLGKIISVAPQKLRRRYGFITEREVDAVIDASGLAYSDQWGATHTQDLARRARRWARQGKMLILLPQALGPFTSPQIRDAIGEVADLASLIYARDSVSYRQIAGVVGERDNIRIAPDFTTLLEGYIPPDFKLSGRLVALVPNCRMLDKTRADEKQGYVPLMRNCAEKLIRAGMKPFFLIHDGPADFRLAETINAELGEVLPVVAYDDPLATKGVLGTCHGVIASRFHALISAFSQGVPSLGTAWSHKYQALFEDYGCPQALLATSMPSDELDQKLAFLINNKHRSDLAQTISLKATGLKEQARLMWDDIIAALGQ